MRSGLELKACVPELSVRKKNSPRARARAGVRVFVHAHAKFLQDDKIIIVN